MFRLLTTAPKSKQRLPRQRVTPLGPYLFAASAALIGLVPSCSEPPEPFECPEACPVITICKLCDDQSCAEPIVSCNPDGSCGDVDWVCSGGEAPPDAGMSPGTCDEPCPVPDICKLCADGSCASANVTCNPDGSCGNIEWVCAP